jgi:FkbM family methyltransferase
VSRAERLKAAVPYARARLGELVPPASERCGRSAVAGGSRVLAAALRQPFERGSRAPVALTGGARIRADLRTPHGRRLYAYGFCEPAAAAMLSLLRPGDVAIDGGANIGLFTLMAAARVGPDGRVVACEPSPTTMALLRENVALNGYGQVDLREVALAERPGRLRMHVFTPGSGFSSFAPADTGAGAEVEVEVATIDEVAGDLLERTSLVKLDVEGAELLALKGAPRLLEQGRPDFIVELEPEHLERQGGSIGAVQALFEEAGYRGYAIRPGGLDPLSGEWSRPEGDPNMVVRPRERSEA